MKSFSSLPEKIKTKELITYWQFLYNRKIGSKKENLTFLPQRVFFFLFFMEEKHFTLKKMKWKIDIVSIYSHFLLSHIFYSLDFSDFSRLSYNRNPAHAHFALVDGFKDGTQLLEEIGWNFLISPVDFLLLLYLVNAMCILFDFIAMLCIHYLYYTFVRSHRGDPSSINSG